LSTRKDKILVCLTQRQGVFFTPGVTTKRFYTYAETRWVEKA